MRIFSKFQDYYDSGLAYGQDESVVYHRIRNTDQIEFTPSNPIERGYNLRFNWTPDRVLRRKALEKKFNINLKFFINNYTQWRFLNFCGYRYLFLKIEIPLKDNKVFRKYCWTAKEADEFTYVEDRRYSFHEHIDDDQAWIPVADDTMNLKYQSPIVMETAEYNKIQVIINPRLKDYGFQRRVDPYQAFQMIQMYLSGPLSNWSDPDLKPEPSGSEKMSSKGMDPVRGFRHRKDE